MIRKISYSHYILFIFSIALLITFSSIGMGYCQENATKSSELHVTKKVDKGTELEIVYPSFFELSELNSNATLLLTSPFENMGIIIYYTSNVNESLDEKTLSLINYIEKKLPNSKLVNLSSFVNPSDILIQYLTFQYGELDNPFKINVYSKLIDKNLIWIVFYSENKVFDRFLPMFSTIFNSVNIINNTSTTSRFNSEITTTSNDTIANSENVFLKNNLTKSTNESERFQSKVRYLQYYSEPLKLSFEYPDFMQRVDKKNGVILTALNGTLGMVIGEMPSLNKSIPEFENDRINFLTHTFNDFSILNSSQSDLLGDPTKMLLFTYTTNDRSEKYQAVEFWNLRGDTALLFTFYSPQKNFDDYLFIVTRTIESLA